MTDITAPPSRAVDGAAAPSPSAGKAAAFSLLGHIIVIAGAIFFTRLSLPPPQPPAYSVELVAAPAGPRTLGAVTEGPATGAPAAPEQTAPDVAAATPDEGTTVAAAPAAVRPAATPAAKAVVKTVSKPAAKPAAKPVGRPVPQAAIPKPITPPRSVAPVAGGAASVPGTTPAGGGPTGGRGRDVVSVKVQGIAFPFPGYLENITRQIALNFKPRSGAVLRAEVSFLIRRDGSVSDLRLVSRSGVYAFDLECIGAVEAVGQNRSFGALPSGFRDDVLPVVFSFDPTVLR